jgi:hypothetical protein
MQTQKSLYTPQCRTFLYAFEEFLLNSVIHSKDQRGRVDLDSATTTGLLETVFVSLVALQNDLDMVPSQQQMQLNSGAILFQMQSTYFQLL